jgi:anthranilate synthase component 2
MHGKTASIRHDGRDLFQGIPNPLEVARYHSLVTDPEALPDVLEVAAWSEDGEPGEEIQAMRHRTLPIWGVQFHPESLFSQGGEALLANFLAL